MSTIYIGIDPGLSGGIAVLHENTYEVWDMPVDKKRINFVNLIETIFDAIKHTGPKSSECKVIIAIEKQSYHRDDGKPAVWTTAMGYASIINACAVVNITRPIYAVTVQPTTWKSRLNVIVQAKELMAMHMTSKSKATKVKKERTAKKVLELYPYAKIYGPRGGLKDGRADALLIATWAKLKGEKA